MRGYWGNHHEKLQHKRILCASKFTISNIACKSSDPVFNNTDTRCSQPNQASCTPDFSYLLVGSPLFSSSSPISLFLIHNSTIITEHIVKASLSISPSHDPELTLSTAYTEYCIHCVLYHSKIDCHPLTASFICRQAMLYSMLYIIIITS